MRKVLVFKETLLPLSETFILEQVRTLTGYEPILAGLELLRPGLALPHEPLVLSSRGRPLSDLRAKLYRRTGTAPRFHVSAKRVGADLVHAHFASGGRTAIALARRLNIPLVVTLHGSDVTAGRRNANQYKGLGQYASLFLCVSEFIRDCALKAGLPPHKLTVHHIGVDRNLFSPGNSFEASHGVLFVGRLVAKKGCEYLLRAMQVVQQRHARCELTVIGEGPLRTSLERLAKELNVRCTFRGPQPAAAVRNALRRARILCVPSVTANDGDSEGLPTVLAEALAMGVPVVGSQHAGIPEIVVNQVTGMLTPERDHVAIAAALRRLLEDERCWHTLRSGGLQHVERHFDLHRQTAALERVYEEVLARHRKQAKDSLHSFSTLDAGA